MVISLTADLGICKRHNLVKTAEACRREAKYSQLMRLPCIQSTRTPFGRKPGQHDSSIFDQSFLMRPFVRVEATLLPYPSVKPSGIDAGTRHRKPNFCHMAGCVELFDSTGVPARGGGCRIHPESSTELRRSWHRSEAADRDSADTVARIARLHASNYGRDRAETSDTTAPHRCLSSRRR